MKIERQYHRLSLQIRGAVQGVGFRPFIYRLATTLDLTGWVANSSAGVTIEVEGTREQLAIFEQRLSAERPPQAQIHQIETTWLDPRGETEFRIRATEIEHCTLKSAIVLPDLATCSDCLQDIFDPNHRRYRYPFTNCTNCGPRYSIIESLPYDRDRTSMRNFSMCPECLAEYNDPGDRRFHAQPNACPNCGPQLELWDREGRVLAAGDPALIVAAERIAAGEIIAIKGLGGFHLVADARNRDAVELLRQRKHRPHKPFAVMYPDLDRVRADCIVSELAANLLRSPAAPIVLLRSYQRKSVSDAVAPENPYLGVMLPSTPLHHLLMATLQFLIVATSGNLADEPICIDEREALERLGQIADVFLVHNRPIVRPVDDSIVRETLDRPLILRRARGYAPLPIPTPEGGRSILAVGGQLKSAIALSVNGQIFLSQHLGDLHSAPAWENFQTAIASLSNIYAFKPDTIACDAHPDYLSSQFAHKLGQELGIPVIPVPHHYAHVLACMADNRIAPPVLGVAWDGTGYGADGTIWGGEFLSVTTGAWERVAHFRPFPLPGGDRAIKEPRRAAMGLLWEIFGERVREMHQLQTLTAFSPQELQTIEVMLARKINTPLTSSVGRLFDAIASVLDLRQQASFEGQAAMELEFIVDPTVDEYYEFDARSSVINWVPTILGICQDLDRQVPLNWISSKFHNTLVEIIIAIAKRVAIPQIALAGGCFQNQYLTERAVSRLRQEGFEPFWHERIPPNDGGLAVGQAIASRFG